MWATNPQLRDRKVLSLQAEPDATSRSNLLGGERMKSCRMNAAAAGSGRRTSRRADWAAWPAAGSWAPRLPWQHRWRWRGRKRRRQASEASSSALGSRTGQQSSSVGAPLSSQRRASKAGPLARVAALRRERHRAAAVVADVAVVAVAGTGFAGRRTRSA